MFELATNLPRMKRIGLVKVANITDQAIYALHARISLERIHLSYCEHLSVQAIHELLEHLPRLTHLSLTGVPAFRREDLQAFCRSPPRVSRMLVRPMTARAHAAACNRTSTAIRGRHSASSLAKVFRIYV